MEEGDGAEGGGGEKAGDEETEGEDVVRKGAELVEGNEEEETGGRASGRHTRAPNENANNKHHKKR